MHPVRRMLQGLPAESNNVHKSRRAEDRLWQMHTLLLLSGTVSRGCYYCILHSDNEKAHQTGAGRVIVVVADVRVAVRVNGERVDDSRVTAVDGRDVPACSVLVGVLELSCSCPSRQLPLLVGAYCLTWSICGDYASRDTSHAA